MTQPSEESEPPDEGPRLERAEHWKSFVGEFLPATILEVFPENALQDLVRGFFLKIRRGVTIVYGRRDNDNRWSFQNAGRVDPYSTEKGLNAEFLNPICAKLRQIPKIEERCTQCDREHAERRVGPECSVPNTYACWLGLVDLLYPVTLEGETIAFVFAGQIPPDTQTELDGVRAELRKLDAPKANELIDILNKQVEQRLKSGLTAEQVIVATREELRVFVAALEKVMAGLHASARRKAVSDLLAYWESCLPAVDQTEEAQWWRRVAELAGDFLAQLGMGRVTLLVRAGKYFDRQWPRAENGHVEERVRVATRDVLQAVLPEKLVPAGDPSTLQLAAKVMPGSNIICFYRTRAASADARPGLLFAVEGRPTPQFSDLGEQFLRRITSLTEYAALTFQRKRIHEQYKKTVSDAAHDFRHPLQNLEFLLARLMSVPSITQDQALIGKLIKMKLRLRQAQEQSLSLQSQEKESREVLNLVELLDEVIEFMGPRADAHPCPIRRYGKWPEVVMIKADRGRIFRVFLNLIDNAIKYSFMGGQFAVDVQVFPIDRTSNNGVKVSIRNFGVGIPPNRLEKIRERGARGEVRDDRMQREGTGIGLSIVARFLNDHGGTFEIESNPEPDSNEYAKSQKRSDAITQGLRYATVVTVRLRQHRTE